MTAWWQEFLRWKLVAGSWWQRRTARRRLAGLGVCRAHQQLRPD